jgi:thymidylate synthase (FAD)
MPNQGEMLVSLAAKRCYNSFKPGANPNVTKVRESLADHLGNVLKQGHGSVFEHAMFNFGIENLTRVATAELNRHRAGVAISEQSLRYVRFTEIPFWVPPSLRENPNDTEEEAKKKKATLDECSKLLAKTEETYTELVKLWGLDEPDKDFKYKKTVTSMLRRILPMGICTGGMWSFNIRAIRHVITMRSSPHAEEEIACIVGCMLKLISGRLPSLMGDFKEVDGFWVPTYYKV